MQRCVCSFASLITNKNKSCILKNNVIQPNILALRSTAKIGLLILSIVSVDNFVSDSGSRRHSHTDKENMSQIQAPEAETCKTKSGYSTLSNRALKRLRGKERRMKTSLKTKPLTKNLDPGFGKELFDETDYYFENGLRKVYPYYYDFSTYAKKRWIGRTIVDVFVTEFRSEEPENCAKAVESGMFTINDNVVGTEYKLKHNDFLAHRLHRHENPVISTPIEILADDEDVVVLNKPPSIPCHPCGRYRYNSIPFILGKEFGYSNLRTIYRLDRLTSGVLICAKTAEKTRQLEDQIANREVEKEYVSRVVGKFPDGVVRCDEPLAVLCHKVTVWKVSKTGKPSSTSFERISYNGKTSVVKCTPHTGRTHQIRVHLQYLGYPIVNDPFYNSDAFGPEKGKYGIYHATEEEITKEIIKHHNIGLWIDGENPQYQSRLEALKKIKEQNEKQTHTPETASHDSESEALKGEQNEKCADTLEKASQDSESEAPKGEPEAKRQRIDANHDPIRNSDGVDSNGTFSNEPGKTCRNSFDESKWFPDESCDSCRKRFIDPMPKDLVMYLHALCYKGPGWEYSTAVPDWAREDWIEEDST